MNAIIQIGRNKKDKKNNEIWFQMLTCSYYPSVNRCLDNRQSIKKINNFISIN